MEAINSKDLLEEQILKFKDIMDISIFLHNEIEQRGLVGNYFGFKIYVYSSDHNPPHVHIKSNDSKGEFKMSLDTLEILSSKGCNLQSFRLKDIKKIITKSSNDLIKEFYKLNPDI